MAAKAELRAVPVPSELSPWQLGGLTWRELARRVAGEIFDDEVGDRAAALSYYFLFSLFPTLLFLTALIGLLPLGNLMNELVDYVSRALPPDAASVLSKTLDEIVRGAHGGLLSIGAIGALWAASGGMSSIMTALNAVYDVRNARPWWRERLLAVGLTVVFSLFTLTALVLLVLGPKIAETAADLIGLGPIFTLVWNVLRWPVAAVLALTGVALVYYLGPNVKQRWYWVTPGSAFALAAWLVMSGGLRLYVTHFANYNITYGSIGGVIVLLLWLYLSGAVLLVGAEINAEIEHAAAERGARTAKAAGEREPGRRTA